MEIIVGTYEDLILGYRIVNEAESAKCTFEASFTDNAHTGSVRAVSISKRGVLATGSSDETIRLFSLKRRNEIGTLIQHEGSINGLTFYGKNHLFSYSDDGSICVWQTNKWECLRTLRGHKGPVFSMSVHPTGKLGLSIGKDKTLRIWNLMTAKCAFITNLKQVAQFVLWAPSGDQYLVCINNKLDVYDVQTASVIHTIEYQGKIHAATFISSDLLALAGEGGLLEIHNMETKQSVTTFDTKTNRVKDLIKCQCPTDETATWIVTASSDGFIKVLEVQGKKVKPVGEINTKFRLLSLALLETSDQSATEEERKSVTKNEEEEIDESIEEIDLDDSDESDSICEVQVEQVKKELDIKQEKDITLKEEKDLHGKTHIQQNGSSKPKKGKKKRKRGHAEVAQEVEPVKKPKVALKQEKMGPKKTKGKKNLKKNQTK